MIQKFPDKEEIFRSILFEILSSLDNWVGLLIIYGIIK